MSQSSSVKVKAAEARSIRARIKRSRAEIGAFCRRHHISRLALFGSVLREDFHPGSDVDVLVQFEPGYVPGFLGIAHLERELAELLKVSKVDLRTPEDLSRYFRDEVIA